MFPLSWANIPPNILCPGQITEIFHGPEKRVTSLHEESTKKLGINSIKTNNKIGHNNFLIIIPCLVISKKSVRLVVINGLV